MMYTIHLNPDICLMYKDHRDNRYDGITTIGTMYERKHEMVAVRYGYCMLLDNPTRLDRILEETIHLCLPSPDYTLEQYKPDDDERWKECMFMLLSRRKNKNNNK